MTNSVATQLSLIESSDFTHRPVGDWEYDELGTDKFLEHNTHGLELGTNKFKGHNSHNTELGTKNLDGSVIDYGTLGTENFLVPNSYNWQPPIGCLEQKPIKDRTYWYWRYYDNRGKKASLYLARDYNKAVARAMRIGIPPNAKQTQPVLLQTNPQTSSDTSSNLIDITSTAHPAPRAA